MAVDPRGEPVLSITPEYSVPGPRQLLSPQCRDFFLVCKMACNPPAVVAPFSIALESNKTLLLAPLRLRR